MPALHLEVNWDKGAPGDAAMELDEETRKAFAEDLRGIAREIRKGKRTGGYHGSLFWTLRRWV
jgi:hypothetical protein